MVKAHTILMLVMLCFVAHLSPSRTAKQLNKTTNDTVSKSLRINDGRDVQPGEYTFVVLMIYIYDNEQSFDRMFSGSMLSRQWVLTSARGSKVPIDKVAVWYGSFTVSPLESKLYSKALGIYPHKSYREIPLHYNFGTDMALYKVQKKADLVSFGTISEVEYKTLTGQPVTYVGGGKTNLYINVRFPPLQVGEGAIVPCDTTKWKPTYICVTSKLEQPVCGDIGGPLLYDGKIIGVLTKIHCNKSLKMFGFTPVSPFLDWIREVMTQEEEYSR